MGLGRLLVLAAAVGLFAMAGHAAEKKPPKLETLMKKKLVQSQSVLEGVVKQDFDKIIKHAEELIEISKKAEWKVLKTPLYQMYTDEFRRNAEELVANARKKNVEAAALSYVDMTLTCVKCHKHVREKRMAACGVTVGSPLANCFTAFQKESAMFEPFFDSLRKMTEVNLQTQQEMFKRWASLWPGLQGPSAGNFAEQAQAFQKKWAETVAELTKRQCQTQQEQFAAGMRQIEQVFQFANVKDVAEMARKPWSCGRRPSSCCSRPPRSRFATSRPPSPSGPSCSPRPPDTV